MTATVGGQGDLRVGVNLLWCLPGEVGGSEQYLVRQLEGVQQANAADGRAAHIDTTLFATMAFRQAHQTALAGSTFVDAPHNGDRRAVRVFDESSWLYSRTGGMDLVHHGGGTAPRRTRRPYVLTIHDLQYRTFPRYFSALKRHYLDAVVPDSARRAAVVTVPSEYVRRSVVTELRVDADRVVVVPHGYEPALLVERTPQADLRQRLGLGDSRVVVYPAMTAPHKRHTFLVELMRRHWTDGDLRLVLIGGRGMADDDLTRAIAASPAAVRDRIVRAGRVSDADRNGLLAMAEAMVFPSQYEGFGAPVVEAMALGAPVVCSDATCLPDVVGDAAVVRPLQLDRWADALDEVAARRAELIVAGRARAQQFTTLVSGRALLSAYRRAAAA
ncbi:MAG: putative glycosyltransferase [Ilumatobacteraceae bacterium]|nr:putative glycosyltransferase [Ilumatobacteraceae bacterium]